MLSELDLRGIQASITTNGENARTDAPNDQAALQLVKEITLTLDRFFVGDNLDTACDDVMLHALGMAVATAFATDKRIPDERLEDAMDSFAKAALELVHDYRRKYGTSGRGPARRGRRYS
jgi:hypothetical protein